jgi:hypothetical protein
LILRRNKYQTPEAPGVFMMHAAMKILLIDSTSNLRQSITEALKTPCTSDAKRFRYFATDSYEEIKNKLLKEYQEKHEGKLPKCME